MATLTTTTSDVFLPELWSTDVTRATEAKTVLADLVHDYSSLVKNNGKQIHIPTISNLVANDKVQGSEVSFQAFTETEVPLNLDKYKEASFEFEDIVNVQSNVDLNSEYTSKAGFALAQSMDSSIADLAAGFSNATGTYNTAITTDVILDSIVLLDNANVPEDGRSFVMKPQTKRDIIDITTYISNDFTDGRPVKTGKIGMLYGLDTYMTTQIVQTGNNTNNMIFHRDAIGKAFQKMPTTNADYNVAKVAWEVVTHAIWGVTEVRDDHGVLVRS